MHTRTRTYTHTHTCTLALSLFPPSLQNWLLIFFSLLHQIGQFFVRLNLSLSLSLSHTQSHTRTLSLSFAFHWIWKRLSLMWVSMTAMIFRFRNVIGPKLKKWRYDDLTIRHYDETTSWQLPPDSLWDVEQATGTLVAYHLGTFCCIVNWHLIVQATSLCYICQ